MKAFEPSPQKVLIFKLYLIHLKKVSTLHRLKYKMAIYPLHLMGPKLDR